MGDETEITLSGSGCNYLYVRLLPVYEQHGRLDCGSILYGGKIY